MSDLELPPPAQPRRVHTISISDEEPPLPSQPRHACTRSISDEEPPPLSHPWHMHTRSTSDEEPLPPSQPKHVDEKPLTSKRRTMPSKPHAKLKQQQPANCSSKCRVVLIWQLISQNDRYRGWEESSISFEVKACWVQDVVYPCHTKAVYTAKFIVTEACWCQFHWWVLCRMWLLTNARYRSPSRAPQGKWCSKAPWPHFTCCTLKKTCCPQQEWWMGCKWTGSRWWWSRNQRRRRGGWRGEWRLQATCHQQSSDLHEILCNISMVLHPRPCSSSLAPGCCGQRFPWSSCNAGLPWRWVSQSGDVGVWGARCQLWSRFVWEVRLWNEGFGECKVHVQRGY